jgi:hypothetical protein
MVSAFHGFLPAKRKSLVLEDLVNDFGWVFSVLMAIQLPVTK